MHLVHASSFSVYNARIRKSHQEHAAEHKERRTCTASVRKFGAEGVGEHDDGACALLYRACHRFRLAWGTAIDGVANDAAIGHVRLFDGVRRPML